MIGFLKGQVLEFHADSLLVDVQGVGYEVLVTSRFVADIWGQTGALVSLWIYTHVREDALQLFGFESRAEKDLFLSLLKVNGIGPKLALGILSSGPSQDIVDTIESGDAKKLSKFPRVGKKTAEQMILTLQGKLVRLEDSSEKFQGSKKEIAFALKNLGFKESLVEEYVKTLKDSTTIEEGVRQGLQTLTQNGL